MDGESKEMYCRIGSELAESGLIGERKAHAETRAALLAERTMRERAVETAKRAYDVLCSHEYCEGHPDLGSVRMAKLVNEDATKAADMLAQLDFPTPDLLPKLREVVEAIEDAGAEMQLRRSNPAEPREDYCPAENTAEGRLRAALATLRGLIGGE